MNKTRAERPEYPDPYKDEFIDRNDCEASCITIALAVFGLIGMAAGSIITYFVMGACP